MLYWGEDISYIRESPVVILSSGIYDYCSDERISLLDVGTSTMNGFPDPGLLRFKRALGFKESIKLAYRKLYES